MGLWSTIGRGIVKGGKYLVKHPELVERAIGIFKRKPKAPDAPNPDAPTTEPLCMAPHPSRDLFCERVRGHEREYPKHSAVSAHGYIHWPVTPARDGDAPL